MIRCQMLKEDGTRCETTGHRGALAISKHHYIKQQSIMKDGLEWYTDNGIKQKTFHLCWHHHQLIHSGLTDEQLLAKYGIDRDKYLFNKRKWLEGNNNVTRE